MHNSNNKSSLYLLKAEVVSLNKNYNNSPKKIYFLIAKIFLKKRIS